MPVYPQGSLNTAALGSDDIYVVIVPPQNLVIQGIATNVGGIVGTGAWGPVDTPVVLGTPADVKGWFGPIALTPHDLVTDAILAMRQGANNLRAVRVTDGTDTAASANLADTGSGVFAHVTARYTGAVGNAITFKIDPGSNSTPTKPTWKATINRPGYASEVFDRIPGGASFGPYLVSAINNGQSGLRGPSELVRLALTAEASHEAPSQNLVTLVGGSNGDGAVTSAIQLGADGFVRTGMYALRGTGVQHFILAGNTDTATWSSMIAFAVSEGCHAIGAFPTATSSQEAVATKTSLGIDDWHFTPVKDFVSFFDSENNLVRSVTPLGTVLGILCNQSPEQSPGNKPLQGLLGTERTIAGVPYSKAESDLLTNAGINYVTNPIPRGAFFGMRHGLNSSTDPAVNGINYTRMTNFLAYSLASRLGAFVEELQSTHPDDPTRRKAENAITNFLEKLRTPASPDGIGMIDSYDVRMDLSNNSPQSIGQGYLIGYGKVAYLSIVRWFLFYLEGGQTVVVPSASQP
ncbi:phage tail protein [bacterium]|nr:phage tail protein [bacterium]